MCAFSRRGIPLLRNLVLLAFATGVANRRAENAELALHFFFFFVALYGATINISSSGADRGSSGIGAGLLIFLAFSSQPYMEATKRNSDQTLHSMSIRI